MALWLNLCHVIICYTGFIPFDSVNLKCDNSRQSMVWFPPLFRVQSCSSPRTSAAGNRAYVWNGLTASCLLKRVFFFLIASGLTCHSCSSSISFEDCIKQDSTVGVPCSEEYKCGKSHYKFKGKDVYSLSCVSIMHCSNHSNICRANLSDCHVTCCGEDLCNTSSTPVLSEVFILTCVMGTIVMVKAL